MGLAALWREPFDHLARYAIHDFRSVSRLCGGLYSPLSFDKLVRSYQPAALYTNRNVATRMNEWSVTVPLVHGAKSFRRTA
jgi:hypothetical protein